MPKIFAKSKEAIARMEDGGLQRRSLDKLMRLFFALPLVRELLITQQIDALPSPAVLPQHVTAPTPSGNPAVAAAD